MTAFGSKPHGTSVASQPELTLIHDRWQARVLPGAGGLIASLTLEGVPVLRSLAKGSQNPLDAACFPMVPWCNRIAQARFEWEDKVVTPDRNFPPEPHAIHGHGWRAPWAIKNASRSACTLVYHHQENAGGWPWAYSAEQHIALTDKACSISLTVTNRSQRPMPAGLGIHPYLRRRRESRVRFAAAGVVAIAEDLIPTGERLAPQHFADFASARGAPLPASLIDHCFAGWDGTAMIEDDCGTITITAEGAPHLHAYAPCEPGTLCLEPVSHLPDAVNRGEMPICAPGATINLAVQICATLA